MQVCFNRHWRTRAAVRFCRFNAPGKKKRKLSDGRFIQHVVVVCQSRGSCGEKSANGTWKTLPPPACMPNLLRQQNAHIMNYCPIRAFLHAHRSTRSTMSRTGLERSAFAYGKIIPYTTYIQKIREFRRERIRRQTLLTFIRVIESNFLSIILLHTIYNMDSTKKCVPAELNDQSPIVRVQRVRSKPIRRDYIVPPNPVSGTNLIIIIGAHRD